MVGEPVVGVNITFSLIFRKAKILMVVLHYIGIVKY